jgi:hypothetical protein
MAGNVLYVPYYGMATYGTAGMAGLPYLPI